MTSLRVTLACGPYDRTDALRTGLIRPEGIDLVYVPIQSPPEIFARMLTTQAFDVSEMSCAHALTHRGHGDFPFVGIPVFPSRMFRHGYIFVNAHSGIREAKDLEGKTVGVPEYSQTAAVWIRGLLHHEYGVSLETIRWVAGGVNAPGRPDVLVNLPDAEVSITRVMDRTLNDLLVAGEIDALIGARKPAAFGKDVRIKRLFPDYRSLEREYYRKTGIFPVMHTVVIREALYREQPWIAESLYKAFVQAKDWAVAQMRFSSSLRYTVPWLHADLEEMEEVFGADPWPYGLERNRDTLETLVAYLVEQRLLRATMPVEELFPPLTLLGE
ncbi:MAG TPA: ABC transporter substrate-binding protein [bacterium]|nr:ABC transporter substrate-binding protein [bacterium]